MAATLGAILMIVTGGASVGDLGAVLRENFTVLAFFLGMMTVTALAEEARVFEQMATLASRWAAGSSRRLFVNVFLLGTVISTFLTNDATALILTPVVYTLVSRLRLDPLPYVFACTFIADTASMTLPVSNPINIILAQNFGGLTLLSFLHYLLLPSILVIAINGVAFAFLFRDRLTGRYTEHEPAATLTPAERRAMLAAISVLAAVAIAFVVVSELQPGLIGVVALAGAAVLLLVTARQGRLRWGSLAGGISWGIFPFIVGMFLLVRGIEHQGATLQLGEFLARLAGTGVLRPALVATFFSAVSSNLINNVPAVAVMSSTIPTVHGASQSALVYGALVGCDLGPNLTVVGSLATMLWLLLLRQRGMEISALEYARLGLAVTPFMLLTAGGMLGLLLL